MKRFWSLFLCGLSLFVWAGDTLFEFSDPSGDDFGAGTLLYPSSPDFERGDLDLTSFSAQLEKDGVWFTVSFRNAVRSPKTRTSEISGDPLVDIARYGFFNLNVDIYIDTDHQLGSGNVESLPGRGVEIARENAWEKTILLTPRPREAQSLYLALMKGREKRKLDRDWDAQRAKTVASELEAWVEKNLFFPDKIKVRGHDISFFVPSSFLGQPKPDWGYAVLVSGADLEQSVNHGFLGQKEPGLMIMGLADGRPRWQFGIQPDSDLFQPPIVDLLANDVALQKKMLSHYNREQLPKIFAVRSEKMAPPIFADLPKAKLEAKATAQPTPPAPAETQPRVAPKPEPENAQKPEPPPQAAPAPTKSVADRLRELEQLRKDGLISEDEYQKLRAKILNDL
ncbi:MAG: hypothetical protein H6510_07515 [Acidobacteria bacterium]|nr:hypothetical protein [Acidobacteriota bacterium]MCB9397645.1 hypothetical protein [Acidobacteriota bacterium]